VMDEQRKTVYSVRQQVLEGVELRDKVEDMFGKVVPRMAQTFEEDEEGFRGWFLRAFGFELEPKLALQAVDKESDPGQVLEAVLERYTQREEEVGAELMRQVERFLLLRTLDTKWKDHLKANDALRAGIGLRGYAQKDPKNEYKKEAYELFERLLEGVEDEVSSLILRVQVGPQPQSAQAGAAPGQAASAQGGGFSQVPDVYGGQRAVHPDAAQRQQAQPQPQRRPAQPGRVPASRAFDQNIAMRRRQEMMRRMQAGQQGQAAPAPEGQPSPAAPSAGAKGREGQLEKKSLGDFQSSVEQASGGEARPAQTVPEAGRNDPCPCGSGKKYKKCHGRAS